MIDVLGCNKAGGGGNFWKVKRLVAKWIWTRKRLFYFFAALFALSSKNSPPLLLNFWIIYVLVKPMCLDPSGVLFLWFRCNALQHTATHHNAMQHIATHSNSSVWRLVERESFAQNCLHHSTTLCNTWSIHMCSTHKMFIGIIFCSVSDRGAFLRWIIEHKWWVSQECEGNTRHIFVYLVIDHS